MTTAQAATRFANGTTETAPIGSYQLSVRERTCSTLTGCTSWSVTPNASSWKIARSPVTSGQSTTASGLAKLHATGGAFRMTFVNTPTTSGLDYRIGLYVGSTSAQFWQDENARRYTVVLGDTRWKSYGAGVPAVMTNHCARMGWTGRQATRDGSVHRDLEAVLLARFDR